MIPMGPLIRFFRGSGIQPPHEFVYGTQLTDVKDLPEQVSRLLSMEFFDPQETKILVSGMGWTGGIRDLISYCSDLREQDLSLTPLLTSLEELKSTDNEQRFVVRLIGVLVEHRAVLRDESKQDDVIVFVRYALEDPSRLDAAVSGMIGKFVQQFDTPKQFREFVGGRCPQNFLVGNINIYPRLIENTSWYGLSASENLGETQPILEIRFMGLGGVFRYILDEAQRRYGMAFFHLDGDSLDDNPVRPDLVS